MTTRILALDQVRHLAFWTAVLKSKKQACGVVIRTMYLAGTESGIDSWSIGCLDGDKYSISLCPDWQGSEAEFRLRFAMESLSPEVLISAPMRNISARATSPLHASAIRCVARLVANLRE
jgi:hypothetical protein